MTGDYNGEGVSRQRLPHSAESPWPSYLLGDPAIAFGLTIGDKARRLPYSASKGGGAGQVQLIGKGDGLAVKVAPQTMGQVAKRGGVGDRPG